MDLWALAPAPGALAFLTVALLAACGRGLPRGRLSLVLAGAAGAVILGALGRSLAAGAAPDEVWTRRAVAAALLLSLPSWISLIVRFGAPPGTSGQAAGAVLVALVADLGLALFGAFSPDAGRVEVSEKRVVLVLEGAASRTATGAFLIAGAFGVLHAQAAGAAARRLRLEPLRRAFGGLVLCSLVVFLIAAQTLLYGAAPLKVIALMSMLFLPASGAWVPVLRARDPSAAGLPARSAMTTSSGVLLGLGAFLILLAGTGEFVTRLAPGGRFFWFRWGGPILLGLYGLLWLVPPARRRLRRLGAMEERRRYAWEAESLLEGAGAPSGGPTLLLLGGLFEMPRGRPAVGLWIRDRTGGFEPLLQSGSPLPRLSEENPLLAALSRERGVLDLTDPPDRLGLVPAYVENLGLVEERGYRLFLLLEAGDRPFGILALAPHDRASAGITAGLLEEHRGELSLLAWGALVAWSEPATRTCDVLASRYAAASDLLHQLAASSARHQGASGFGARISAAAEEAARLLESRAHSLRRRAGATPDPPAGTPTRERQVSG